MDVVTTVGNLDLSVTTKFEYAVFLKKCLSDEKRLGQL